MTSINIPTISQANSPGGFLRKRYAKFQQIRAHYWSHLAMLSFAARPITQTSVKEIEM
jgi:hypothetical protein